jgi:hypothetical protein
VWSCGYVHLYVFMALCLNKHKDNFVLIELVSDMPAPQFEDESS